MNNQNSKRDLTHYKQSRPQQLQLFELDPNLKDYSNSIELYDTMPKYFIGGVEREKGDKVESLPILNREFMHRGKPYKLDVSPAAIHNKKSGKTIHYYPSQREELVEDALRKIATKGSAMQFDDKVGVKFTYYEVQQELKKMGHGYSITEIKLAVEILGKAGIEIISKDDEVSVTSNFFTWVGKETKEMGGKEKVIVMFHQLVTKSINRGDYRLFNYDKLMKMKMPLARWLHKRISHMFSQATVNNPYQIKLSTIVRDSGMKNYKTISERIRQFEKALEELKRSNVITNFIPNHEREKNKILDVTYALFVSEEFVADAKKANKLANLRLGGGEEKEVFNIDELRKEIEKPIYGLTKTVINNYLSKISTKEDHDLIVKALEAVREYIELKKSKNEKITNHAAITKAAIREGWSPKQEEELPLMKKERSLEEVERDQKKIEKEMQDQESLQENQAWLEIRKRIKVEFGDENWEKWFSSLRLFSLSENEIIFAAESKFIRDWIIREFLENPIYSKTKKTLKQTIRNVMPTLDKVGVICVEKR